MMHGVFLANISIITKNACLPLSAFYGTLAFQVQVHPYKTAILHQSALQYRLGKKTVVFRVYIQARVKLVKRPSNKA